MLDLGGFVADVQRGDNPLGDDAGAEVSRRTFGDPPLEDQADLGRTSQIKVLTNDFLEQMPSAEGTVKDLGARKLRLQDGQLRVKASGMVFGREGIGQTRQPLFHQGLDLGGIEFIDNLLLPGRVGAGEHAVIQRLEGDAFFR